MNKEGKIVVIADDFTGAAEIGGIGLRYGLRVAIETCHVNNDNIDLLVIATDTRSMSITEATRVLTELTEQVNEYNPLLFYKKIDSVLRGNVAEEIESQLKLLGLKRALMVAANPFFNRIIKDGKYYIDNIPLNESRFSVDSQFPIKHNEVAKILKPSRDFPLVCCKPNDELPDKGILIADVENLNDLHNWAHKDFSNTLLAGASGFFSSLLESLDYKRKSVSEVVPPIGKKVLFVYGSSFPKNRSRLQKMEENGHLHLNMPKEIYDNKSFSAEVFEKWCTDVINGLKKNDKVIVSSIHKGSKEESIFIRIKSIVSELVKRVFQEIVPDEVFIEGGSTTTEILSKLKVNKLIPLHEFETGLIRMKVENIPGLLITTKPGSYMWPEKVWLKTEIEKFNKEHASI